MSKSIKKNFIMNIILTLSKFLISINYFSLCFKSFIAFWNRKSSLCNICNFLFFYVCTIGYFDLWIRACAQVRDDRNKLSKVVHELCVINGVTMILAYLTFFCGIFFVERLRNDKLLFLIMSSMILFNSIGMEWLYKALEEYTYIAIRSIGFKAIAVVMMLMVVKSQSDYVIYGAISIFAASASNIMNCVNAHKYISLRPTGNYNFRQHIKPILIFFGMSCATTIYTNFDTVMLGFIEIRCRRGILQRSNKNKKYSCERDYIIRNGPFTQGSILY